VERDEAMTNLEIPYETWQAIQARVILNSSEEVSWKGKAIGEFLGRSYEMDVTYYARFYQGRLWLDMTAPYIDVPSSSYRRKQKSPARMSRKWRELRKKWHTP
jgi:hypothetical protein